MGLPKFRWNSVVNKASVAARTNRLIGGRPPSLYLASLERQHNIAADRLSQILHTHRISPDFLRRDEFDGFLRDRASKLLDLIEAAMGKSVPGRDAEEVIGAFGAPLVHGNASESAA